MTDRLRRLCALLPPLIFLLCSAAALLFIIWVSRTPETAEGPLPIDRYLTPTCLTSPGLCSRHQMPAALRLRPAQETTVQVLMYHALSEDGEGSATIAAETFSQQMQALSDAGYHTVSPEDLAGFVYWGNPLPDKPLLITFDDGYTSNYDLAYPILKKLNMKAAIFLIGVHTGRSVYKDTGSAISPHFTYAQALEMESSGLISIQSHTYDMHQWAPLEPEGQGREGVLPLSGESRPHYRQALWDDLSTSRRLIERYLGSAPIALAYPQGLNTKQSEAVRKQLGYLMSFTVEPHDNTLVPGQPESLSLLGRYNVDDISPSQLLEMLSPVE